jgi:Mg2+-importing ATPase
MTADKYWAESSTVVLEHLESSEKGLDKEQAAKRLQQYGHNELSKRKARTGLSVFLSQFSNPLVIILIAASIVAAFLGELADATIIIVIVIINGLLGFFQEYRSERALERLRKYITFTAEVVREGSKRNVDTKELVPGDIVLLKTGDVVPSDIRLIEVDELSIDESSLTGESYPAGKVTSEIASDKPMIHEMKNVAFMGTYVKEGQGIGVTVATGNNTFLGKTAQLLKKIKRESEFQKSMAKFGFTLIKIVLASVVLIFLVNFLLVRDVISALLFSLALAIGMVPEALPIVITIALSSGALLLAKKNVVVKRLVSVEDLGNVDVVCTDKTGTITENRLTLEKYFDVNGTPEEKLILYSLLCNSLKRRSEIGNPMDMAIWKFAKQNTKLASLKNYSLIKEIPFDSTRKKMSVVVKEEEKLRLITKGAPESILDISTHVCRNNGVTALQEKKAAKRLYEEYGNKGYRVIAVAYKEVEKKESFSKEDESDLILLGYIAFMDPPKKTAKHAFKLSKKLKLDVKILTGDGPFVSKEIARQVGLKVKDNEIILGQEIDRLSDQQLQEKVNQIVIVSRATPEHKYRVVKALRAGGRVTACLGDGVNDAPALKEADVGIAVDQGSDIAKDAADIVLLKKGLNVIVDGIKEGRRTFSNIVKYVLYTIAGNFGDLYTIGAASVFLHFLPLLPSQLILANFLTDTPVVAVSTDNVEKTELVRPRRWDIGYIFKFGGLLGLVSAAFDVVLISILFSVFNTTDVVFRTALFLEIVLSEILVLFIIRTDRFFLRSVLPSRKLLLASLLAVFATFALIYLPISYIFDFAPLSPSLLGLVFAVTIGYALATEIVKLIYFKRLIKPRIKPMLLAQYIKLKSKISESERELREALHKDTYYETKDE